MQERPDTHVLSDAFRERTQQRGRAADPVGHGGAVDLDALARVDHALPVQRQGIGVFRHDHVSEKARSRPAALDRERRQRRLHHRLAGAAAQLRPHVRDRLEVGGDVFEHFGHVLADLAQHRAAATGTGGRRLVHHLLAWQVLGQRLAAERLARRPRAACGLAILRRRRACGALRHPFLEVAEEKFQLLDLPLELLRGTAEARAPEHRQLGFEMLDLKRLGVELRVARRNHSTAFGEQRLLLGNDQLAFGKRRVLLGEHPPQRAGIAAKLGSIQRHEQHDI